MLNEYLRGGRRRSVGKSASPWILGVTSMPGWKSANNIAPIVASLWQPDVTFRPANCMRYSTMTRQAAQSGSECRLCCWSRVAGMLQGCSELPQGWGCSRAALRWPQGHAVKPLLNLLGSTRSCLSDQALDALGYGWEGKPGVGSRQSVLQWIFDPHIILPAIVLAESQAALLQDALWVTADMLSAYCVHKHCPWLFRPHMH